MKNLPTIEEILALDLLTLREHTERAGDALDPDVHRTTLARTLQVAELVAVRKNGALIAYATLTPQEEGCWFVTGFNTHPAHRTSPTFRALFAQMLELAQRHGIGELRSHVYKTNRLSLAFHQRLGFRMMQENDKAVAFHASLQDLVANSALYRSRQAIYPCVPI